MQSQSFTKLFASITDSSIWGEDDATRIVWITMLAMADCHGYVGASIPGLAARARKSIPEVEAALAKFKAPDPYSRTRDFEGRRVADALGGWVLLTYEKHREVARAESLKESKRRWAAKARAEAREAAPPVATITLAELVEGLKEVEASRTPVSTVEQKSNSPSVSVSLSGSGSDQEGGAGGNPDRGAGVFDAPTTAVAPKRGRFAPDDFEPTPAHRDRCRELRFDVVAMVRDFKLHEFGRDYTDWDRRFSRWIEDQRVRAETERAKRTYAPKDRPNQGNHGVTGLENAEEIF